MAKAAQAHLVYLLQLNEPPTKFSTGIMNASMGMINSAKCWGYLDFKLIQDMCGRTLTDDDIRWVLLAIDGVNTIKSLKLTHCFDITGECLESLSGSTVLERIDLSLAEDNESPYFDEDTKLSFDNVVVVVLESILNTEGNSLVHIQLPKPTDETRSAMIQFLDRFGHSFATRQLKCSAKEGRRSQECKGGRRETSPWNLEEGYWNDQGKTHMYQLR